MVLRVCCIYDGKGLVFYKEFYKLLVIFPYDRVVLCNIVRGLLMKNKLALAFLLTFTSFFALSAPGIASDHDAQSPGTSPSAVQQKSPTRVDAKTYLGLNTDLRSYAHAHNLDEKKFAKEHFDQYGKNEGRLNLTKEQLSKIPKDFDPRLYLTLHPDVATYAKEHGQDPISFAKYHYLTHGANEQRTHKATQGAGHVVSQNPKAPLTGEQLNAMPPEVQANIHRMLSARNQDALSNGNPFINRRAIINGSTDELSAGTHTNIGSFDYDTSQKLGDRQKDYTTLKNKGVNVADAGTPLAEAALKTTNKKLLINNGQVIIHSLTDVQSVAQQMKNGESIDNLFFINGTQFLKHIGMFLRYMDYLTPYGSFNLVLQISKEELPPALFKELIPRFVTAVTNELGINTQFNQTGRLGFVMFLVPYTLIQDALGDKDRVALKKVLEGNTNLKNKPFVVKDNKSLCKNLNFTPAIYERRVVFFKLID
jgi:hypothetical protein